MTINQLAAELKLKKLTPVAEREVLSCYISDLLSRVMGSCREGDVWITVQTSMNMVAVALMIDVSCVIFPEGLIAPADVMQKANEEGLTLFSSEETAYQIAVKLAALIKN